MTSTAYLVLGSNQGNRSLYIAKALSAMALLPKSSLKLVSKWYETAAWGKEDMPPHINVAVVLQTNLLPSVLLSHTQAIEHRLGRERQVKWGERTLDIDIILFDELVLHTDTLIIPHPYMQERRFVLAPLAEIAPNVLHPIYKKTLLELLNACPDQLSVAALPSFNHT